MTIRRTQGTVPPANRGARAEIESKREASRGPRWTQPPADVAERRVNTHPLNEADFDITQWFGCGEQHLEEDDDRSRRIAECWYG